MSSSVHRGSLRGIRLLSVPTGFSDLALLHFGARRGQDCAGDEVWVVDHRHVSDVGQDSEGRLGQSLMGKLAIWRQRSQGVLLRPCDCDRAWQWVHRSDLLFLGGKNFLGNGAREDIFDKLDGLGRG